MTGVLDKKVELKLDDFFIPDWPCPPQVKSCVSTRKNGYSVGEKYAEFNLSFMTGDDPELVSLNRKALLNFWSWERGDVCWIKQVHGNKVIQACNQNMNKQADAVFSTIQYVPCIVTTADCLPVLFCDKKGSFVGAAHAGWRGLVSGVLENTVKSYSGAMSDLLVWFGPHVTQPYFEVGCDVRDQFIALDKNRAVGFEAVRDNHWLADLVCLAKISLQEVGVENFYGGHLCSYAMQKSFYSYRRDGRRSGRMATAVWLG